MASDFQARDRPTENERSAEHVLHSSHAKKSVTMFIADCEEANQAGHTGKRADDDRRAHHVWELRKPPEEPTAEELECTTRSLVECGVEGRKFEPFDD